MRLKKLQEEFAKHIYNPKNQQIRQLIDDNGIDKEERLQIYRNNIFGSFDGVLASIYPAVKKLIGDDYFAKICKEYHQKFPSQSGNLDEYGQYFSHLIKDLQKQHKIIYLSDIAKMEWLFHYSYFARNVKNFDIEKFQKLPEEDFFNVKFALHPSCYLLQSKYPIYSIWQLALEDDSNKKLDLDKLPKEFILIERAIFHSNIHPLKQSEFLFLKAIKNKQNLYQIYQDLNQKFPDFDIGSMVNKYISNGILARFYYTKSHL